MTFDITKINALHRNPIKICVIGHTNHGKTSTIQTLVRDASFGEVDDAAGTTTRVNDKRVHLHGKDRFLVSDTPGFELLSDVVLHAKTSNAPPSIDGMLDWLNRHPSKDHKQIIDTLRQVQESHILIHVIDTRESLKQDYKDEIEVIHRCGLPLVVSLNFTHVQESRKQEWVKYLKSQGIHTIVDFDAHSRSVEDEIQLYEMIGVLLSDRTHKCFLEHLVRERARFIDEAIWGSASDIAELIVNVAKLRQSCFVSPKDQIDKVSGALKDALTQDVISRKDACLEKILRRFGFAFDDIDNDDEVLSTDDSVGKINPFNLTRLRIIATATATLTFVGMGMAIDTFIFVGTSFGAFTVACIALAGALTGSYSALAYEYIYDKKKNVMHLSVSRNVLIMLVGICTCLARDLKTRGRAVTRRERVFFCDGAFVPSKDFKFKLDELRKSKRVLPNDLVDEIRRAIEGQGNRRAVDR